MGIFDSLFANKVKRYPVHLYNTLSRAREEFVPLAPPHVRMYNCGPTVYGRQHIGNLSMFVFTDVLRRMLEHNQFDVQQVINFTDFGHLSGDNEGNADIGEDRMSKGLKSEGLALTMANMKVLGEKYANIFLEDIRILNVSVDSITFPRASDYIAQQIDMIKTLVDKGVAYTAKEGVYFDTATFPRYGELGNIDLSALLSGARVQLDTEKRNPTDFLLWKSDAHIGWDAPWGTGFPGWHIECSAMIRAVLGDQIDIHTGGIEHISIHHNNEIAQSESATGKRPFARYWLHRAHLQIEGGKISKSEGKVVYLADVIERGFHPLSLRYLLLNAHYRTPMNFTWEALSAAQAAYGRLLALRHSLKDVVPTTPSPKWLETFYKYINDDLDTPSALASFWTMTKDKTLSREVLLANILDADKVFGLCLDSMDDKARALAEQSLREEIQIQDLPEHIRDLVRQRESARRERDWARSDQLRTAIIDSGYALDDSSKGQKIFKVR